jgi:hypothetical protein
VGQVVGDGLDRGAAVEVGDVAVTAFSICPTVSTVSPGRTRSSSAPIDSRSLPCSPDLAQALLEGRVGDQDVGVELGVTGTRGAVWEGGDWKRLKGFEPSTFCMAI